MSGGRVMRVIVDIDELLVKYIKEHNSDVRNDGLSWRVGGSRDYCRAIMIGNHRRQTANSVGPFHLNESKKEETMSRRTVGTERDDEAYNMRHSGGRGIAVYFGFSKFKFSAARPEVEGDKEIMKKVYENLGFHQKNIRLFENLSDVKLKKEIKKLQKTDYTNFDCIFITVSTHGLKDYFTTGEETSFRISDFIANFCGENIKSLIGKPKIFLFQCCRGSQLDDGVQFYADSGAAPQDGEGENIDSGYRAYTLPTTADILITMSTTEGYAAFREQLFKYLLETLEDAKLRNDDFASVIVNAMRRLTVNFPSIEEGSNKLMPSLITTLTRKLYFHPA
ncbi:hypothetical protein GE061_000957 [Apolygus lucorum]|uniref:Caspase family p20 domain-containing protein n=1 Tax=Apolygus lucorum TaxID=248454 RepID=A0A8S9Y606_APOLU|nr:hypothetical protein GE061_000957 [Apolygus lucorum]